MWHRANCGCGARAVGAKGLCRKYRRVRWRWWRTLMGESISWSAGPWQFFTADTASQRRRASVNRTKAGPKSERKKDVLGEKASGLILVGSQVKRS